MYSPNVLAVTCVTFLLVLHGPPLIVAAQGDDLTLYVAADGEGSDANNGTSPQFPLATVAAAIRLVGSLRRTSTLPPTDARIRLSPGTHELNETLSLDDADACSRLTIDTYNGTGTAPTKERAILSGGSLLSAEIDNHTHGFFDSMDRNKFALYSVYLSESQFPQKQVWQIWLPEYVNGTSNTSEANEKYHRVSLGSTGIIHYESRNNSDRGYVQLKTSGLPQDTMKSWSRYFVYLYHSWTSSISAVESYSLKTGNLDLQGPVSGFYAAAGDRYQIVNYPGGDETGFVFDPTTRMLHIKVKKSDLRKWYGDHNVPTQLSVVIPRLQTLTAISNCSLLTFRDVEFSFTDSYLEETCLSFGCDGQSAAEALPIGAVHITGLTNSSFESVVFAHQGVYALVMDKGTSDITVGNCLFTDLGAGGIRIGVSELASAVTVTENTIRDGGHVVESGTGILLQHATDCTLSNNLIHGLYYTGISTGWTWGYQPTENKNLDIAHNYIYNIGRGRLSDMGCIYNLGLSPGTQIHHNLCHDVQDYGYGGWGLYLDEGSSEITLTDNIIYRCKAAGMLQHYGLNNVIANNIFAYEQEITVTTRARNPQLSGFASGVQPPGNGKYSMSSGELKHNIFLLRNASSVMFTGASGGSGNWGFRNFTLTHNCYWSTAVAADKLTWPTYDPSSETDVMRAVQQKLGGVQEVSTSWSTWQDTDGKDDGSIIADPLFPHTHRYDFNTINGSSPCVVKAGFKPIAPLPPNVGSNL